MAGVYPQVAMPRTVISTSKFVKPQDRPHNPWVTVDKTHWEWPRYWQRVIARIRKEHRPEQNKTVLVVSVLNPEFLNAINNQNPNLLATIPPMSVGTIEFDTPDELDAWARVADRLTEK